MKEAMQIAAVGLFLLLAFHFLRRPCNFRIRVRQGKVQISGSAIASKAGLVNDFFQKDLPEVRRARIQGYWDGRRLRLHFGGELSPAHQQRIRNFLLLTL
jgi:hypothetical protein